MSKVSVVVNLIDAFPAACSLTVRRAMSRSRSRSCMGGSRRCAVVEALAEFPGLVSVESLQGGEATRRRLRFVLSRAGLARAWWVRGVAFLGARRHSAAALPYRLTVAWNNGGSGAWAQLHVDRNL